MDVLNVDAIFTLINRKIEPSISIYMPTYRKGSEAGQNTIRYKNLIRQAEKYLHDKGLDANRMNEFLFQARAMIDDIDFWNHQLDGLAIYISPGEFNYFKLPKRVEEKIVFSDHFHLKPVLPLLNGDVGFYLLTLDLNHTRLFKCTHYTMEEIKLQNTMTSLEEYNRFQVPQEYQDRQGAAPSNSPQSNGFFHGHGADVGESARKKDITELFRFVDKGVKANMKDTSKMMILAGVEYLIPLYKEANSYQNVSEEVINKNPQDFTDEGILNEAWNIVRKQHELKTTEALTQFGNLSSHDKASSDISEVIKAAHTNKILHLFVNFEEEIWGKFNPDTYEVEINDGPNEGNEELITVAVQQTIYHNGFVYPLSKERMPNGMPLAAVFRY